MSTNVPGVPIRRNRKAALFMFSLASGSLSLILGWVISYLAIFGRGSLAPWQLGVVLLVAGLTLITTTLLAIERWERELDRFFPSKSLGS